MKRLKTLWRDDLPRSPVGVKAQHVDARRAVCKLRTRGTGCVHICACECVRVCVCMCTRRTQECFLNYSESTFECKSLGGAALQSIYTQAPLGQSSHISLFPITTQQRDDSHLIHTRLSPSHFRTTSKRMQSTSSFLGLSTYRYTNALAAFSNSSVLSRMRTFCVSPTPENKSSSVTT